MVGLHEGVIETNFSVSCSGAFYGCGGGKPMSVSIMELLICVMPSRLSDNTYFATVMQRVINNPKYPNIDSSLAVWDRYMYAFGLGHKLGVDVPSEKPGNIPTPTYFNKIYGDGHGIIATFVR